VAIKPYMSSEFKFILFIMFTVFIKRFSQSAKLIESKKKSAYDVAADLGITCHCMSNFII